MGGAVDCARMCVCKLGFAIFYFSKEEFFYQRKTCHGNKFVCAERSFELGTDYRRKQWHWEKPSC